MDYLSQEESIAQLREYLNSKRACEDPPELTPNILQHVYCLLDLERFTLTFGSYESTLVSKPSLKLRKFCGLMEALLLSPSSTANFISTPILVAFLKKLARIGLTAQTPFLLWLIPFLFNCIQKYEKTLLYLIDNEDNQYFQEDPFNPNTSDPSASKAAESSLWEVALLLHHYYPRVGSLCKSFSDKLSKRKPFDLDKYSQVTFHNLVDETIEAASKGLQGYDHFLLYPSLENYSSILDI